MPWGLTRFHHSGQSHFVTFCCYHRCRLFTTDTSRQTFESALERVRRSFTLQIYGYVVMPEHVHLLISEPEKDTLADALKSLKQGVARRLLPKIGGPLKPAFSLSGEQHFWQKRYYDFNIRNYPQFVEKLRYIHRNPGSPASPFLACRGGSRSRLGCANVPRTRSGAVFATTQPAVKDGSRSSRNGQHENANELREDFVQR